MLIRISLYDLLRTYIVGYGIIKCLQNRYKYRYKSYIIFYFSIPNDFKDKWNQKSLKIHCGWSEIGYNKVFWTNTIRDITLFLAFFPIYTLWKYRYKEILKHRIKKWKFYLYNFYSTYFVNQSGQNKVIWSYRLNTIKKISHFQSI